MLTFLTTLIFSKAGAAIGGFAAAVIAIFAAYRKGLSTGGVKQRLRQLEQQERENREIDQLSERARAARNTARNTDPSSLRHDKYRRD